MRDCSPIDMLSDILNDVPDLVFAYGLDERYLFVNRRAGEFLGDDPLDVIGFHWRDLGYPAEVMERLMDRVAEVASSGTPIYYRLVTSAERGGRTLDMSLTPLRRDDGGVFAVLAIAHDVSEFFG
ncbi:MAG: PAS domain-containing protein [Aeromicrobium sp.]|jgi:PAS domain S-box-containing protein|nr:PAS domain-containing protein [Aeromicrobium sp.]